MGILPVKTEVIAKRKTQRHGKTKKWPFFSPFFKNFLGRRRSRGAGLGVKRSAACF